MLGLYCRTGFSLVAAGRGYPLVVVHGPHCGHFSCCRAQTLRHVGFSSCGLSSRTQAQTLWHWGFLRSTWHLPGSGIKPVSFALADRFFTTESPGKPVVISSLPHSFLVIGSQFYRDLPSLPSPLLVGWRRLLGSQSYLCACHESDYSSARWSPGVPPGPGPPLMPSMPPHMVLACWSLVKTRPGSGKRSQEQRGRLEWSDISTKPAAAPCIQNRFRDFLGSLLVKAPRFPCRGRGFNPWLGK